ncbi:hypothetical protein FOB63_000491 [Clavispora lusitaniae]|uniref:uncharacterized protein n=1 Tax=Clavispora lusitaniae TaxID=36911 RepID=UPI00202C0032|nr:hypothetical protein FOB63_000491 [Clavispora lusitaniae]
MNFYIVPSMSYQAQQKMNKNKREKQKQQGDRSRKGSSVSDKAGSRSSRSSASIHSSNEASQSIKSLNEPSRPMQKLLGSRSSGSMEMTPVISESDATNFEEGTAPTSSSSMKIDVSPQTKIGSHSSSINSEGSIPISPNNVTKSASSQNRHLSFSQVPTASMEPQYPPESMSPNKRRGKMNTNFEVPPFQLITDLSILNDDVIAKKNFFNPSILDKRFHNYLNWLSEYQSSDPLNFAAVRAESMMKLIKRHGTNYFQKASGDGSNHIEDTRYYEGLLAYEAMQCRSFIKDLLYLDSKKNSHKEPLIFNETLIQLNFANYVWYLLRLPNISLNDSKQLDEIISKHYHFKAAFGEVKDALYNLNMESYSGDILNSTAGANLLLQSVTKVANEFMILENYLIHILNKFGGNSLIEHRVTKHLFSLFDLNLKLENTESLKVLHYNMFLSDHYSWNLAINIPFVRVFEMNVHNELKDSVNDMSAYQEQLKSSNKKTTFSNRDKQLFDDYFKNLDLQDYEQYRSMSGKDFVELQKSASARIHKFSSMLDDATIKNHHKPPNFEYYSESLSTIASDTFHVIHCRDAYFQLTQTNYKVVLSEFHRLLKRGGILELPLFIPGESQIDNLREDTLMGVELEAPKPIPNFIFTICDELYLLFGAKNVKYAEVLLSPQNMISNFWINHVNFLTNDAYGDVNAFCAKHQSDQILSPNTKECHYFYYIRAEKI